MLSEREFDAALTRIQHRGITHYADPACQNSGQIYHSKHTEGRKGTYFHDPDRHLMEILTPGSTTR